MSKFRKNKLKLLLAVAAVTMITSINSLSAFAASYGYSNHSVGEPYYKNGDLYWDGGITWKSGSFNGGGEGERDEKSLVYITPNTSSSRYPKEIGELTDAVGLNPYDNTGSYGGTITRSYSGFQVIISPGTGGYYVECTSSKDSDGNKRRSWRMGLNKPGGVNIQLKIPHGTSLTASDWTKAKLYYCTKASHYQGQGTSLSFSYETRDLSSMISHVKSCTGGNWQTDANQHWKICGTCGYTAVAKTNHTWTTTKAATCTATGTKKCSVCGYTATIPALGHQYSSSWTTTDGTYHYHKCNRCSAQKDKAQHTWQYSNWDNPSTHDKTCTVCSRKVPKEAHNFGSSNKCACGRYNTSTVSFNLNKPAGITEDTVPSNISNIVYTYGDKYYDSKYGLVEPTLADYIFEGWYTAATGGTKITENTNVTNSNTHTLYAHWTAVPIDIKALTITGTEGIEYTGQSETEYNNDHDPDSKYEYGSVTFSVESDAEIKDRYQAKWEIYDGTAWKELSGTNVNKTKDSLTINNVDRTLNNQKVRLTITNNAGSSIISNESTISVYWLPQMKEIQVDNKGYI